SEGQLIISKADFEDLQLQFSEVNGLAIRSTLQDTDLKEIYLQHIKKNLDQSKIDYENVKKWNEYYQYPLLLGVLVLIIAWCKNIGFPRSLHSKMAFAIFLFLNPTVSNAQEVSKFQKGF